MLKLKCVRCGNESENNICIRCSKASVTILLFSTPSCPKCKKIKKELREKGYVLNEVNMLEDGGDQRELINYMRDNSISYYELPIFNIFGEYVFGVNDEKFHKYIN